MIVDGDCPQGKVCPIATHPRRSGAWWWPGSLHFLKREGLYIRVQSSVDDLANLIILKFPITDPELTRRALDLVQSWYRAEKLSVQTKVEIELFAKSKKVDGFVENVLLNRVIHPAGGVRYIAVVLDATLI
jgi:hypothetical protein